VPRIPQFPTITPQTFENLYVISIQFGQCVKRFLFRTFFTCLAFPTNICWAGASSKYFELIRGCFARECFFDSLEKFCSAVLRELR